MSATVTQQIVEAWLAGSLTTESKVKVDVTSNAASTSASTMANFLGTDESDPGATGTTIYSDPKNLPTAVACILNRGQNAADFHPASQTPEVVAERYARYITEIDRIPFMHLQKNDQHKQAYDSSDYNVLIDNIVSLYDGVSQQDKNQIKESIANLAKSVFSQSKSEVWTNLFSQATLNYVSATDIKLYIYYTTLYMRHENKGKDGVSDHQEYTVNRVEYKILTEMIGQYAQQLAKLDKKNVDDWTGESSTPQKEGYKLCFTVEPVV